ncbi:hypothetical protein [Aquibium oceanicum]|uniref:Uncharacterized protein n=1 Tax=Aquibium oceanicum TaxID=1670800 RepID=A0A1L3SPX8_9HYPH|nr:hypothetical protein [Aquibium oceanicum]APH71459.1 hypothetical protein BSQ44_08820 [Aquibium oceanicum]
MLLEIPVEPIRPGYPYLVSLLFPLDFWEVEALATGRMVAHFRLTVGGTLLHTADSDEGAIARDAAERRLDIALPAEATKAFTEARVVFDFARIDPGGGQRAVPGLYDFPVKQAVTRDV